MIATHSSKLLLLYKTSSLSFYSLARPDPNGVLNFLVQELQVAEKLGQRAWIIGHVAPGSPDAMHDQVSPYSLLVLFKFTKLRHCFTVELLRSDYSTL